MLYVMWYMLSAICYLLHVICYLLHVICYTLNVIRYMLYVIRNMLYVNVMVNVMVMVMLYYVVWCRVVWCGVVALFLLLLSSLSKWRLMEAKVSNLKTHENHPQFGPAFYRRRSLPLTNLCIFFSLSAASLWSNCLSSHSSRSSPSWLLRGFPKISLRRDHPSLHLCYHILPGKVLLTFSPSYVSSLKNLTSSTCSRASHPLHPSPPSCRVRRARHVCVMCVTSVGRLSVYRVSCVVYRVFLSVVCC